MANKSPDDLELSEESTRESTIINASKMELGIDIDDLLNEKAKKNQLNYRNVKLLIKNILTNDDVVTMLRQTLDENMDGNCLYEPKLTRARIREMLKTYPSSVDQWSQNQQQSIISECRSLIDNEFPDDSEDEEYKPEPQIEDDYDDDDEIFKCTTIESSEADNVNSNEEDHNTSVEYDEETIGMRTRSKFPLNDTPLETIEQAFIPPDITEDMYDSACENDEWIQFLSEFTKPLESVQNDDTEDDPEYNVLGDAEFSNVDKEEFRKDKSVKISRKEYNELMSELNEYTDSYINFNGEECEETDTTITEETIDTSRNLSPSTMDYSNYLDCKSNNTNLTNYKNLKKSKSSSLSFYTSNYSDSKPCNNGLLNNDKPVENNDQIKEFVNTNPQISDSQPNTHYTIINEQLQNSNYVIFNLASNIQDTNNIKTETTNSCPQNTICDQNNTMLPKQTILLKQQLTQHVQLLTQSYILCSMTQKLKSHCQRLLTMVEIIKTVSCNKKIEPINIHSALNFIQEWKTAQTYNLYVDKNSSELPLEVKELILFYDKPLFMYPELLPIKTYYPNNLKIPIGGSEERVLIMKIDCIYRKLKFSKETRTKYRKKNLLDMLPVILKVVHKRWFSFRKLTDIKKFVSSCKNRYSMNLIKNYLLHGKIDETVHMVDIGPVFMSKCLYECRIDKFPTSWKPLLKYSRLKNHVKKKCTKKRKCKPFYLK
ncbi:Hypothetical protein CINCED_3A013548 [Cinara cedri]|uniref:GON-4-like protein n=1 Tax=Cinara cedri TaxID=506608 RepID=A0A5E4MYS2_9HEMI|nr:Hypothetical protein CINCED_3A013548 [Cinara cedri]